MSLLYSGSGQLNVVLPGDAALGDGSLIVRRTGWTDVASPASIVPVAPGVFTLNETGRLAALLFGARRDESRHGKRLSDSTRTEAS